MKRLRQHTGVLSLLVAVIGIATLWYIGHVATEDGLYADAHHTGGYTTPGQFILAIVGCLLVLAAVVIYVSGRKK